MDQANVYGRRQQLHAVAFQQSDAFQKLDEKFRDVTTSLAKGPKTFDAMKVLLQNKSALKKEYISREFRQHEKNIADDEYCRWFLKSLYFPEIHSRQEEIANAHKKTFQWIFDESGEKVRPWSNFIEWLEEGSGTYWISGKAGSGKSTLMNYV